MRRVPRRARFKGFRRGKARKDGAAAGSRGNTMRTEDKTVQVQEPRHGPLEALLPVLPDSHGPTVRQRCYSRRNTEARLTSKGQGT